MYIQTTYEQELATFRSDSEEYFARFASQFASLMCLRGTPNRFAKKDIDPQVRIRLQILEDYVKDNDPDNVYPLHLNIYGNYQFKHKTFYEFFVAKAIVTLYLDSSEEQAISAIYNENPLNKIWFRSSGNKILCNHEPGIIDFLASRIKTHPNDKERWVRIIKYSRKTESKPPLISDIPFWDRPQIKAVQNRIKAVAANAITILNWAGVSFSGEDLSGVRIKGAVLSQMVGQQVNFSQANLKDVQLQQSFLRAANLSSAKMQGVAFGEHAYLSCQSEINCLSLSPDGKYLAAGAFNGEIYIYTWQDKKHIKTFKHSIYVVSCLAFDSTSKQLASGGEDETIYVLDIESENVIARLSVKAWISCLTYGPIPEQIIFGTHEGKISSFNITNNQRQVLQTHQSAICCLAYHPIIQQFVSASIDGEVRLWSLQNKQCVKLLTSQQIKCIACHPSRMELACGGGSDTIEIWSLQPPCQCLEELFGHHSSVSSVVYDQSGKQLISGSYDGTIRIWDAKTKSNIKTLYGHSGIIRCLAYYSAEEQIISAGSDRTLRFWDSYSTSLPNRSNIAGIAVACNPNGKEIVTGDEDGKITVWDLSQASPIVTRALPASPIVCLCYKPSGTEFAALNRKGKVFLCTRNDKTKQQKISIFRLARNRVLCLAYQPTGLTLATGGHNLIQLLNLKTYETIDLFKASEHERVAIICMAYSPDGRYLAAGGTDNTVKIWNLQLYQEQVKHPNHVGNITVINSLLPEKILPGHRNWVNCLAYHPSGKELASGSEDKTIRIWNLTTNAVNEFPATQAPVRHLQYVLEGDYLISWHKNGEVFLWQVATKSIIDRRYLNATVVEVVYNDAFLVILDRARGINFWRAITGIDPRHPQLPDWQLQWTTNNSLDVKDMNIKDVKGLTPAKKFLLQQSGAVEG